MCTVDAMVTSGLVITLLIALFFILKPLFKDDDDYPDLGTHDY